MKPKCILIVDDDQNIREMLDQFLGQYHQCMTRPVSDPEAALAQLRRLPFNLVLTDINHPGMDGLTLTRQVRRRNGPPVIVMTGYNYELARRRALAYGARACLRKPFKLERLAEIIELVVGKGVHYIGEG